MGVVYTILSKIDGKIYVGKTKDFSKRRSAHRQALRKGIHTNEHLQRAFNKYGEENFEFEVLEEWSDELLLAFECYWTNLLNSTNDRFGYNYEVPNPNGKGGHSIETKNKLKKAWIERKKTLGYLEGVEKLRKMSLARKGQKSNHNQEPSKEACRKPVIQYSLKGKKIREFHTSTEAAKYLVETGKCSSMSSAKSGICGCCKKSYGYKTYGGFKWKYAIKIRKV